MTDPQPISCMWCGGKLVPVAPPAMRKDWPRCRCKGCNTILYPQIPNSEDIGAIYAEAWDENVESGANGSTVDAAARSIIRKLGGRPPDDANILDYGAGSGVLCAALAAVAPGRTYAFEPYGPIRDIDGAHWSNDAEGAWSRKTYFRIFLSEVIEHLPDPVSVLSNLGGLLAENGAIVVTTPNANGIRARKNLGQWREAQNPAHLTLFTARSLDLCAKKAGLQGFSRRFITVEYKDRPLAKMAMSAMQLIGIDGGLRGLIRAD